MMLWHKQTGKLFELCLRAERAVANKLVIPVDWLENANCRQVPVCGSGKIIGT